MWVPVGIKRMMKDTKLQRDTRKGSRIPSSLQFHRRWEKISEKVELEIYVDLDLNTPSCRENDEFSFKCNKFLNHFTWDEILLAYLLEVSFVGERTDNWGYTFRTAIWSESYHADNHAANILQILLRWGLGHFRQVPTRVLWKCYHTLLYLWILTWSW